MIHGFFNSVEDAIKFVKEQFPTYTPNINEDWRTFDKWISPDEKAYVKIGVEILSEKSKALQAKMKIKWKEMGMPEKNGILIFNFLLFRNILSKINSVNH